MLDVITHDSLARKAVVVNSYELVNELSDDSKFYKTVPSTLQEVRRALGDGLFTVSTPSHQLILDTDVATM